MKMNKTLSTLLAGLMLASTAMAQPGPQGPGDHDRGPDMQRPGPGNGGPQGGRPGPGAQQPGRPGGPGNGFGPGPGRNDRPGPQARWNRGDRLPPDFRGPQYRIDNPRAYGLAPAPRGHYWVSSGSDFLLVAAATGIITSIILNGSR